jgi:PAS domain S-box-containing protein
MKFFLQKGIILSGFILNLVVLLVYAWVSSQRIKNTALMPLPEIKKQEIAILLDGINSDINNFGNSIRIYTVNKNEEFLDYVDRYQLNRRLTKLRGENLDNKFLLNRLDTAEKLIDDRIKINFQIIELTKKSGTEKEIKNLTETSWKLRYKTRILFSDIEDNTDKAYREDIAKLNNREERLKLAQQITFLIAVILLLAVFFMIRYYLLTQKRSEKELTENRHLLQSIIDNTSSGIMVKDMQGTYLLTNKQFEKMFRPHGGAIEGKTDLEIFPKETANRFRETDLEVIKNEREQNFEESLPHNGETLIYDFIKFPLYDEAGKIYAVASIANDITKPKIVQEQLMESEAEFQTIFAAAPDAIVIIDKNERILKWNTRAIELFGWSAKEVEGKRLTEVILSESEKEKQFNGFRNFTEKGNWASAENEFEIKAIDKEKTQFYIELSVSSATINDKKAIICFMREISKRSIVEQEIRRSNIFLDSIIDNIPATVFVKDAKELRYVILNKSGEVLTGISKEEMIGKNDYDFFPKEQADSFISKDREVLEIGGVIDIPEEFIDTQKGRKIVHTKKIPIMDEDGEPIYLLGISEDITRRKELDNQRRIAEKNLVENERRLKLILENIGEGVMVSDLNYNIILFNNMARELFEPKILSAKWADNYKIYHIDGKTIYPAQELPLEKALKGEVTYDAEMILHDQESNKNKLLRVTGHPIFGENNAVIAAVATIRDITRFRQLEAALNESELKYRNLIGFRSSASNNGEKENQ